MGKTIGVDGQPLTFELLQVGTTYRHFPRVPADMACPFCGGYVRGHQFISADTCSIIEPFYEPGIAITETEPDWHHGCTGCWRTIWHSS